MTLAEALGKGLEVTVIGLIIVFAVLVILMLVLMAMKAVFYHPEETKKEEQPATVPAKAPQAEMDEGELIAVLTAAIAASMNTSTYQLNIKSYRRIDNNSPAWSKAGLRDVIDARF